MTSTDIWVYREPAYAEGADLIGYRVEAIDGHIGKIDDKSDHVEASYLVVDTGPWIFGRKAMLPAGVVGSVDHQNQTVHVNRTKEQIRNAPEFNETGYRDSGYQNDLGIYYGPGGTGWRD